jgi:predicted alpha/beta superfamily hydrolase
MNRKTAGYGLGIATLLFMCLSAHAAPISIIMKVPALTPTGPIYLTGSSKELCEWKPDCLPMRLISPHVYAATINLDPADMLEFKVNRGTWETAGAGPLLQALPNFSLQGSQPPADAIFVASIANWADQKPLGITGHIEIFPGVFSAELGNRRTIRVWLPPNYATSGRRYPVVYMHDGENLFDPTTSLTGVDWGVDETMTALMQRGLSTGAIIVGLDSTADRFAEYDYNQRGALYAHFLINTVKPEIDRRYRTLPDRLHTFSVGSSMGGHISFALVWKHSDVFSGAGCLSLPVFKFNSDIYKIMQSPTLPTFPVRIYIDNGTYGNDAVYTGYNLPFVNRLRSLGFNSQNSTYLQFPYADHSEVDWARRVNVPLLWLMPSANVQR